MNKDDDDYLGYQDKYPKVGLLNEELVKEDYANGSRKPASKNTQSIELSEYQPLSDEFDPKATKPIFNPRTNYPNSNNTVFQDKKDDKAFNPFNVSPPKNNNPNTQQLPPPPVPPQIQNPNQLQQSFVPPPGPPPMYVMNPQPYYYPQPSTFPTITNFVNSMIGGPQQPLQPAFMPINCPKCSLYQAIPVNSTGFICPRCHNVISVFNTNSASRILVCDKCKSNVIFMTGSSPLIECSNCRTINYAAINDPQNIYGPKK